MFYAIQGIVSIFMPAIMGIIADKWIQAQRLLGICHLLAGLAMAGAGIYGVTAGDAVQYGTLFGLYAVSIAFFMPTIAISNSVAYTVLEKAGKDPVKDFPPIRVWGTVGFICSMWFVDLVHFRGAAMQETSMQYVVSGVLSILLALYTLSLPECPINRSSGKNLWWMPWDCAPLPFSSSARWRYSSSSRCFSELPCRLQTVLPILPGRLRESGRVSGDFRGGAL